MGEKKAYVLDTNVLLSDAGCLHAFEENDVIVPLIVLEELDRHKGRLDEVGRNARQVSRTLDDLRKIGSLASGVALPGGGKLRVVSFNNRVHASIPLELDAQKVDNLIIAFMLCLRGAGEEVPGDFGGAILVSKDVNVRIKCDGLGITCEDYRKMRAVDDPQKFYGGVVVQDVDEAVIDAFYAGSAPVIDGLHPNQVVVLKHSNVDGGSKSALAKHVGHGKPLVQLAKIEQAFGLKPRNKEQKFSLDLLFDPNVRLVTLTGASGCGKTLLSLAAGLEQLRSVGANQRYDKLIVTRPIQPVGKDIGFLPGTLEEKMEPWVAPIRDNLNFLMDNKRNRPKRKRQGDKQSQPDDVYLRLMQERGLIEIEAITFIRGRSIPNAFMLVDEAQNLSMHELKTILTRVGEGTKVVLTGDLEQIDNNHVDVYTNGLTYAIERFKEHAIAGHITLIKGERSELATLASKLL